MKPARGTTHPCALELQARATPQHRVARGGQGQGIVGRERSNSPVGPGVSVLQAITTRALKESTCGGAGIGLIRRTCGFKAKLVQNELFDSADEKWSREGQHAGTIL